MVSAQSIVKKSMLSIVVSAQSRVKKSMLSAVVSAQSIVKKSMTLHMSLTQLPYLILHIYPLQIIGLILNGALNYF